MLLLLMFAVVVLCSPAGVLLGTAWLSYTAEDGAADKHRRAGAAGHTICPAASRQCSDNSLQTTLCRTTLYIQDNSMQDNSVQDNSLEDGSSRQKSCSCRTHNLPNAAGKH